MQCAARSSDSSGSHQHSSQRRKATALRDQSFSDVSTATGGILALLQGQRRAERPRQRSYEASMLRQDIEIIVFELSVEPPARDRMNSLASAQKKA
jgi:hypothetical protein